MGKIYIGNTEIQKVYRGNVELNEVYQGKRLGWKRNSFPNISNLKLRLEASEYPGSGTTWTDSAQSIIFNSNGTQTPYTTIAGAPCFDFNGSGYWESGAGAGSSNLVDMRYSFTIILLYYAQGIGERDTIFEKAGTSYQSYEQEIAMTAETDQRISYYRGRSDYDYSNAGPINLTSRWNFFAAKSEGTTTRSGAAWNQSTESWVGNGYTSRSNSSILQAGAIRVGTGYAGTMENGYIGSVLVYNRALSTSEMSSLYTYYSSLYNNLNGF